MIELKNNSLSEIYSKLMSSKRILMSLHSGPDGDSLGACTAMKFVLEKQNKKVKLISHDELPGMLSEIKLAKEIEFGKDITDINLKDFEILLAIDTPTPEMLGKFKKNYEIPNQIFVINIDHHPTNPFYGNLNYIDSSQPSACSVLMDLFQNSKVKLDSELSTRLLLGLCTDSGFFKFSNAEKAIKQASFLIENGGKYFEKIVIPVLYNQPLSLKKYYSLLIEKLKISETKKFGWAIVTEEEIKKRELNRADIRVGPNELADIKEFDFIFSLAELDNEIKGSFRSRKGVDVSLFAKALGGGGHKEAAGFSLPKMPLQDAEALVLKKIEKVGIHKSKDIP